MDEQTNPAPEPTTTTPDPVVVDIPTTEPPQAEPAQVPVEPISTPPTTPQTEPVSEPIETLSDHTPTAKAACAIEASGLCGGGGSEG